jgi:hypothetical protein
MTCKDKWLTKHMDFKNVLNYMTKINHNTKYWDLTPQEKRGLSLP